MPKRNLTKHAVKYKGTTTVFQLGNQVTTSTI